MRKLKVTELDRLSAEDYRYINKAPISIVLDNVRSFYNVGSVLRTADAFTVKKVYLCGIAPQPPHREIRKTAIGAEDTVGWEYRKDAVETVRELKDKGHYIIPVEQAEGSTNLQEFRLNGDEHVVLVFGHEVKGVDQAIIDMANQCLEIPQFGTKHSLNISVSAGIVIWEVFRKLKLDSD